MCEKAAPELLKYELAVVERLKTKVEGQVRDKSLLASPLLAPSRKTLTPTHNKNIKE